MDGVGGGGVGDLERRLVDIQHTPYGTVYVRLLQEKLRRCEVSVLLNGSLIFRHFAAFRTALGCSAEVIATGGAEGAWGVFSLEAFTQNGHGWQGR